MPFIKGLPQWNNTGGEPVQSKKDEGWLAEEKPPASIFNWFFNRVYLALQELQGNAIHTDQKGAANGVAELDENSQVPAAQLPLNNTTSSTSAVQAATANAVKTAYDLAGGKYTKPGTGIPKADLETAVQTSLGKADSALQALPTGTTGQAGIVQLNDNINSTSTTQAATANAVKKSVDDARKKVEQTSYKTSKTTKDANGIYTTVEHRRKTDNTLAIRSVLSGGTSPKYTTRTVTYYGTDGTTVEKTDTFTISYDTDGDWTSEV